MNVLRQSTSTTVIIGQFVDDTDGKTAETGLTIANTDVKLMKQGAASVNKNSGGGTHRINGDYAFTFDATDSNTVGELRVSIVVAGALPVNRTYRVITAAIFDALYGASAAAPLTTLGANAPANWFNAGAIATGAFTNAKFAAGAIDANAIAANALATAKFADGALTGAKFAAGALNGLGNWNIGKTGYELTGTNITAIATETDARLLNAGDATDFIAGLITRLDNTNVNEATLVAALKAALFDSASIANKLAVDATGRVTIGSNADKTGYALTVAPLTAVETRAAVGLANADLDTKFTALNSSISTLPASIWNAVTSGMTTAGSIGKKIADWVIGVTQTGDSFVRLGPPVSTSISADIANSKAVVDASKVVTDKLNNMIVANAANFQFNVLALALAPTGSGAGGSVDLTPVTSSLATITTEIGKIPKAGETLRFSDADEAYDVQISRIV